MNFGIINSKTIKDNKYIPCKKCDFKIHYQELFNQLCFSCKKVYCGNCFKYFCVYFEEEEGKQICFFEQQICCSKKCIIDNLNHEDLSKIMEILKREKNDQKYKIEKKYNQKDLLYEYQFVRVIKPPKIYYKN